MTQPDELFPDDAANAGSLAEFAAKTQSEWETEQRQAEMNRWSILGGLSLLSPEAILDAIGSVLAIPDLGTTLQKLAVLPGLLLGAATGENPTGDDTTLEDLFDVLRDLFGRVPDAPTDITPPTAPTLALHGATHRALTLTASGGIDP